ncbi:hypothetical protein EsH8_III_000165 [Colletotrichum jinshuiense]
MVSPKAFFLATLISTVIATPIMGRNLPEVDAVSVPSIETRGNGYSGSSRDCDTSQAQSQKNRLDDEIRNRQRMKDNLDDQIQRRQQIKDQLDEEIRRKQNGYNN